MPRVSGSRKLKPLKIKDVSLRSLVWLKAGGNVKLCNLNCIEDASRFIKSNDDFIIIGAGSNTLITKESENKVLAKLGSHFNYVLYKETPIRIVAGAATPCSVVSKFAMENGIKGFEFLSVIPGNIGGAIAMNAGAYGNDVSKIMLRTTCLNSYGELFELTNYEIGFKYRGNSIPKNWMILEAGFRVERDDPQAIKNRMAEMIKKKRATQVTSGKTCGSLFKNPQHGSKKAWELIDEAGFRGFAVGDAQISEKHCNFLVNNGSATTDELLQVCHTVKDGVKDKFGIDLEFELVIV